MAGKARFESAPDSSFAGNRQSGQRGYSVHTLNRSTSFRERADNRNFASGKSNSRGSATTSGDGITLSQCLLLEPVVIGDKKYARSGDLRRVLGFSFGDAHLKNSSSGTVDELKRLRAVEELKRLRASVADTCVKASDRAKKLDDHLNKLNKYFESMSSKKQLQNEMLTNDRSSASTLKIGSLIHRITTEFGSKKLDDRPKNVGMSNRLRTSVAETRADCWTSGVLPQPLPVTKERDLLKDSNADSDIVKGKRRRSPAGGESREKKMKMKHSVGAVLSRSVNNDGELKRTMHHKLPIESGLQSSDSTHSFRLLDSMAALRKLKGGHDDVHKGKADVSSDASHEEDGDSMEIDSRDSQPRVSTRGRTHMYRLAIQKARGVKTDIRLNKLGQAVGKEAAELQSYIGVLARENVKITYKSWKHVPKDVKELIWESVNLYYNVDPIWKKACLSSAGSKWRQYKTNLTRQFVWKHKDHPKKLKKPPKGYGISQEDWNSFVISRMSESFMKLSEEQKERRNANIYPHRLARRGYAALAEEIESELCDDAEINRAILWKKGRANKNGEIEGDHLKETVAKIDNYIEQKKEGKLKIEGATEDILTKALENQEHAGRVRGIGGHITPSTYFRVLIGKKPVDRRAEQRNELMEAKKLIAEQGDLIKEQNVRLEKLEAIFIKKYDTDNDEKASCSVKPKHQSNKDEADFVILDRKVALEGSAIPLTFKSKNEVDAYGTIVHADEPDNFLDDEPDNFLDDEPIPTNCMYIANNQAMTESTPLPVKIPMTRDCLDDVVGNHVDSPTHLIKLQNEKPSTMKVGDGKNKSKVVNSDMPRDLYMFYGCCKNVLQDGKSISITLDDDVFGTEKVIHVDLSDITHFCELESISCYSIIVYIWHLYKKMKEDFVDNFLFVDPYHIGHVPTTRTDKSYIQQLMVARARFLADRLSNASINQVVLAPCNIGYHWILTVIDPYKETVHVLDPLGPRIRDETWRDVVNLALKLFNADKGRKGKKKPQWEVIRAPIQPDEKQCGFFVMRYMREILHECINTNKASLRTIFKKGDYTRAQIDEVRLEWAKCIQDHMFE